MKTMDPNEENLIKWTVQPPGMETSVEVMLKPYALEENPPEGYARLVTIEYNAILERNIMDQIRGKAGGNDGIIKAAVFLEDLLGGTLPRRKCIRVVKDIINPKAATRNEYALLLNGSYWVSEADGAKIENMRGVKTMGKESPRIDATVEWPENVPDSLPEIDGELAHPPQTNRIVAPPRDRVPVKPIPKTIGSAAKPPRSASIKKLPPGDSR